MNRSAASRTAVVSRDSSSGSVADFAAAPALPSGEAVANLEAGLRGEVVRPDDAGYDDARSVWNGMIDRRPALVVRCADVADVRSAVAFAREHGLPIAVRGGGHNVSGNAVCDGGVVVDLSALDGVDVDADRRRVRAEGGVTIGALDRATQAYGLAVPQGIVSETGVAGLTLGGGLGWLRRRHGLSCDNLVAVELVTADGQQVRADEQHHPELFWAVRGGGGNFGVVTAFEFRAHPVGPDVFVALVFHPWDGAASALRHWREWQADAPDEVSSLAVLWHAPAIEQIPQAYHHQPVLTFAAVHTGAVADGERELDAVRGNGAPIADLSAVMPYTEAQQVFDEDYPAGLRYYWKSRFLTELTDEAVDVLMELTESSPSPHSTLDLWQLGGEMARVSTEHTAFGDRSAPLLLGVEANWEDTADDDACLAWARRAHRAAEPFSTGAEYLNFPGFLEEGEAVVRQSFGTNYPRLVAVKNQYDPANVFRLNQNVTPDAPR
ncbi:FAD/FMN-containing dehydrogenase [Haloactinopolyspora alba]|uniref:FAD/FMN-containing dehydrogenase n=1 Tax=Haloactinopolyspora alba TaxID=648780 RepID=A0A2P8DE81_9ACTN|nr:FAD-binding oxidoreductase [Haloactinopolyspora alba]PSK95536.1 FAD/FMN-containing dehydrogenase [Haloactinopolyspora alba]